MQNDPNKTGRTPPKGMPHQAPRPDQHALRGKPAKPDPLPKQRPVDEPEEDVRKPSLAGRILRHVGLALLLMLAVVFIYIFLLLGEPDDEAKTAVQPSETSITIPMSALDMPGESDVQKLADSFGQPVLSLNQMLTMYKARIFDTALDGEYARCVTITYTFEDGQQLLVESIRPTKAVSLLKKQDYTLDASALYSMGGLNAARMHNDTQICVFAQSDTAVYAVTCPRSHEEELAALLRYTILTDPAQQN